MCESSLNSMESVPASARLVPPPDVVPASLSLDFVTAHELTATPLVVLTAGNNLEGKHPRHTNIIELRQMTGNSGVVYEEAFHRLLHLSPKSRAFLRNNSSPPL